MVFRPYTTAFAVAFPFILILGVYAIGAGAQSEREGLQAGDSSEKEAAAERVVIHREALRLTDPESYRVRLQFEPIRSITLLAPTSGVVELVEVEVGQQVQSQFEAVRLDTREQSLLLDRAKALRRAAEIEVRRAGKQQDPDLVELAEAKLAAARADEQLAEHRLERMHVRAPFAGTVLRVHVTADEPVSAGDPLLQVADTSRLQVEVPVDRTQVKPGDTIEIDVEETTVAARIDRFLPLADRFAPLLDLVRSLTSAVVVVDNPNEQYQVGQAVRVPVVPEQYVTQITNEALVNMPDGRRKVQVVRNGTVRDIPVRLLSPVGPGRSYVTGAFVSGDEVVTSTSMELPDGTQVRPLLTAAVEEPDDDAAPPKRSSTKAPSF